MQFTKSLLLCLAVVLFSACRSNDTDWADLPPAGVGIPWPANYPVGGDSVAVLTIEQDSVGLLGEIVLEFYPDRAPNHVRNFKYLANTGFFDSTTFHRVIEGFVIQGGDPNSKDSDPSNDGLGGPGWSLNQEFNSTPHVKGILSMARYSDPNSAGSQFFICHGNPRQLDNQYTVFGNTIRGLDVVDTIANTPVGGPQNSTPLHRVVIRSARIAARSSIPE
jgi:cyclophilin family peptidyl-prolyl cis-trans isomerase